MSKVAEVQVALASGAMREAGDEWVVAMAGDEWVVAVGGATKTIKLLDVLVLSWGVVWQ
jgi:hypothetical protein